MPVAIEGEHLPTEVGYDAKLQTLVRSTVCAEIIFVCKPQFHQLSRWLVSDDPGGEEARCGGPGLKWLYVVCGRKACWTYCQIL
jgi:hypothetical protein